MTCTNGRVTSVDLTNLNLGPVSLNKTLTILSQLEELTSLKLSGISGLYGELTSTIGKFSKLETLVISNSPLVFGTIPAELGLLSEL